MILVGIHVSVCIFLVFVILLQRGKGDAGIGFGSSGSSQSIFGSRGAGNFLTKTTGICAAIFLLTSFLLTRLRMDESTHSVIPANEATQEKPLASPAAAPSPVAPAAAAPAAKENAPAKK